MTRLSPASAVVAFVLAAGLIGAHAQSARSVSWERARSEVARYRAVADNSGLVDVDAMVPPSVDAEDLGALCEARRGAVLRARHAAEQDLAALPPGSDPITDDRRAAIRRRLGAIASFEGQMDEALRQFAEAAVLLAPYSREYPDLRARWLMLEEAAAVASLRRGEIANCIVAHNGDRCIFPIRPGGVHRDPAGARAAMERLGGLVALVPENLETRWLLNLSAMVIGTHPQSVARDARLAADLFAADRSVAPFQEIASQVGLGRLDIAGGTVTDDFDNDGLFDVVFTSVDFCSPARLYRNRGDGTFEDRTEAAGLATQLGGLNATHVDYDNDGWLDLFIHRGGWEFPMRNSLLRNNGDGTFTDVTRTAGLSSGAYATHSVAWLDADNDGHVDVFVGHELAPSQLFRNTGDGRFSDVTATAGVGASTFVKGVTTGDYDNDGDADLYLSNMFGDNLLYRNDGTGRFTEVGANAGVQSPFASFPTWFFDYDNDGALDLFVASYPNSVEEFLKHYLRLPPATETLTLYRNRGDGTFENASRRVGLDRVVPAMGANFGDIDNDGFLDLYLGSGAPSFAAVIPNVLLRNDRGRRLLDVTAASGTGHLQKGHGVAFADLDRDGDQDLVLNVGGAVPGDRYEEALFENPGTAGSHWLGLKLVGTRTNRAAIGARLTVTVRDGGTVRSMTREVSAGGSFGSGPFAQHVGLGRASGVERIVVRWPVSGRTQTFTDIVADRSYVIREDEDAARPLQPRSFSFGSTAGSHRH